MSSPFGVEHTQRSKLAAQRRENYRRRIAKFTVPTKEQRKKMRVIRQGPNTALNRKQLAHHAAVGAGLGASVGAATGAHLGAAAHRSISVHGMEMFPPRAIKYGRGKTALLVAGTLGATGAILGAGAGMNVASIKRQRRAMSKAVGPEYVALRLERERRRAEKEATRPRKPYFNPTAEQKAATGARRAEQASFKAGKQFRRVRGPVGYTLADHIHPGQVRNLAVSTGLVVGGAALIHHDRKQLAVAKADHVKRDTAAGAVVGAGAVDAASVVVGQGTKAVLKERRVARGESPHEAALWSAHKKSHGVMGRNNGSVPNAQKLRVFRSYPKELPDWRIQRALAVKNSPKFMVGSLAAGAATGAAIAHHRANKPIAKADSEKEAAAGVASAGAGQGAYQLAGYQTKHYVDRHTRKQYGKVTPQQVKMQDKLLAANKKKFGIHLPQGTPGRNNAAYHRAYPRQLPYSGAIRTLGHTHEGRLGIAIGTGATMAAGTAGVLAERHHLRKSEAVAITGKLWRRPTVLSELRRGFRGTVQGERKVAQLKNTPKTVARRNAYGYPRGRTVIGDYGSDARHALDATTHRTMRYSPHRTGFQAGVAAGHVAGNAVTHPEYAISVPAAGAGVGLAHHEIKRAKDKKKKGAAVTKSAFGVEEVAKLGPPKVHYRQADLYRRNTKRNSMTHYGPTVIETERTGTSLILRRKKYDAGGMPEVVPKHDDFISISPRKRVRRHDARRLAQAYESNSPSVTLTSGATFKHRAHGKTAIAKYDAGTITLHHEAARMHARKKASGYRQVGAGTVIGGAGVAAHVRAPDIARAVADRSSMRGTMRHAHDMKTFTPAIRRGGLGVAAAGGALVAVGGARAIHHGHKQNVETEAAQAARRDRMASLNKSAFGVVDKSIVGEALSIGSDALKGLKGGLAGKSFGTAPGSLVGQLGAKSGNVARKVPGKLQPLVNTPKKAAVAGILGGTAIGGHEAKN